MATVVLRGLIISVSPREKSKDGKTEFVNLHFKQPQPINDFGEPVGKESIFKISVFNKNIEKISDHVGKDFPAGLKAEIKCYMNGRYEKPEGSDKFFYNIDLNLASIELK